MSAFFGVIIITGLFIIAGEFIARMIEAPLIDNKVAILKAQNNYQKQRISRDPSITQSSCTHPVIEKLDAIKRPRKQLIYEKLATEKIAILNGSRRMLLALKNSIQNFWWFSIGLY